MQQIRQQISAEYQAQRLHPNYMFSLVGTDMRKQQHATCNSAQSQVLVIKGSAAPIHGQTSGCGCETRQDTNQEKTLPCPLAPNSPCIMWTTVN